MGGIEIGFVISLITIFSSIGTLFWKLRGVEKDIEKMVDKKIKARVTVEDEVQVEKDKLTEEKYKTLWLKVTQLESYIIGNPKYNQEGLVMKVEKIKLAIKALNKGGKDE